MNDGKDLQKYLAGDLKAFERIVSRHERSLLRFTAFFLSDSETAQDIVQESFLKLIVNASGLTHLRCLSTWLYKVCRNASIDFIRKEARMRKTHEKAANCEANNSSYTNLHEIEKKESQDMVVKELHKLPHNQQEVLILKIKQQKSYREISEITGLTSGNIGYLVHHGLKNLAVNLKAAGAI